MFYSHLNCSEEKIIKYYTKIGMDKAKYTQILKEINEWEGYCCEEREETIDDLSESVYHGIVGFIAEDGFNPDEIYKVMANRKGGDIKEWSKI